MQDSKGFEALIGWISYWMRTDPKEGIGVDAQLSRSVDGAAAHRETLAGSSLGRAGAKRRSKG